MTANVDFKYINPELYRHHGEKEARDRLKKLPGFNKAIDMMSDGMVGKAELQAEIASMIRVGPGVYPVLHDLWNDTLGQFGLSGVPLHIAFQYPQPWAIRGGDDSPVLVVDGRWLDVLQEKEMAALLAMQAGAIRLGNASYFAYADLLRWISDFSGIAGAPAAVISWGMENWRRYAMFSCDRAAALSMGDPEGVVALLERIAGAGGRSWGSVSQPDAIRLQGIEALSLDKDWSNSRWRRFAMAMNRQNSVALVRRLDLQDWFAGGDPARILSGEMTEPAAPGEAGKDGRTADPGLAYWGEFANSQADADDCCKDSFGPVSELMGMAEKGINSFWKAGEAFLKSFQEKS